MARLTAVDPTGRMAAIHATGGAADLMPQPDTQNASPVASVALNLPLDRQFDYAIPEELRGQVPVGGRVYVPFGNRGRVLGYCVKLKAESDLPMADLKAVIRSLDTEPIFTPTMLKLARWMADYYQCSLGEALHAALPAAVRTRGKRRKLQFCCLEMTPRRRSGGRTRYSTRARRRPSCCAPWPTWVGRRRPPNCCGRPASRAPP